jgi:hypothetical protein
MAFFITHLDEAVKSLPGVSPKREEFRRPGSAQVGDEKRLGGGAPAWLTAFPRFSSPC